MRHILTILSLLSGLVAGALTLFGVYSGPESHFYYPNGDEVSYVEIVYLCRDYSGELRPQPDEVDELRWFAADALPENISPSIRRGLLDWAAKKNAEFGIRNSEFEED